MRMLLIACLLAGLMTVMTWCSSLPTNSDPKTIAAGTSGRVMFIELKERTDREQDSKISALEKKS